MAAKLCGASRGIQGPEFDQQQVGVIDHARRRCIDERKFFYCSKAHGQHAQDHRRQGRPQDLRLRVFGPGQPIFFAVKAYTGAGAETAATAGPLIRAGLGNGFDGQALNSAPVRVTADSRQPRIDNEADSRNGQRRFGHVGRQDYPAPTAGVKNTPLLRSRQARIQRQNFRIIRTLSCKMPGQEITGFTDFTLTGKEDQNIAPGVDAAEACNRISDTLVQIPVSGFCFFIF